MATLKDGCQNAFLQGEDKCVIVYMKPIPGYSCPPQALLALDELRNAILFAKFQQSDIDHSLFIRHTVRGYTFLLIYVDDIIIISGNDEGLS